MNLYRVKMNHSRMFYVAAKTESGAARKAEKQWEAWKYHRSGGSAVSVELVGLGGQYPPEGIDWFLK